MKSGQLCLWKKEDPHSTKHVLDELADSSHLPNAFRADKYQCFWGIFMYVMSWYSRASVMFSVFA